ncbi:MAG: MFS transporter [Arsenicicoccus sp.]|uniref:MFS transporter n=1 Tax=Serinicoccus profundi TaxID=1078471 RepID=UPI000255ECF9|nr:MFS transporter [Serinicoccus profundi]PZU47195.1 MAG: MFS transporter [Arsenicicoccus sp.]
MTTSTATARRDIPLGRPFGAHLGAVGLANLADGVVQIGVPLLAVTLTRSPLLMGVLTAAVWLPWLVCGIPAGMLVDRWDRRRTMLVALGLRAVLLGGAAAVALTDRLTIWVLVGLALGYGITEVFTDLAAAAQVPALVGRAAGPLRRANARLLAVEQVCNGFVGPPLAGVLVALGAAWLVGSSAAVVVSAVLVLALGLRGRHVAAGREVESVGSRWSELTSGMRVLWRHPVLRPLAIAAGLWNFASTAFGAVLILWLVGPESVGGLSPQLFSLVMVVLPAGALLGSMVASRIIERFSEMSVLVACWGLNAVFNLAPLLWPSAWGLALFLLAAGPLGVVGNIVSGSLRPRLVAGHQLGRVGGASRVLVFGAMPLGALVGGQVAALAGIPVVLAGVPAVMLLATVLVAVTVPQASVDAHVLAPEPEPVG